MEWLTKLEGRTQSLLEALDNEVKGSVKTRIQPMADELTVSELRATMAELDSELSRLHGMRERIIQLKDRLKEISGI